MRQRYIDEYEDLQSGDDVEPWVTSNIKDTTRSDHKKPEKPKSNIENKTHNMTIILFFISKT